MLIKIYFYHFFVLGCKICSNKTSYKSIIYSNLCCLDEMYHRGSYSLCDYFTAEYYHISTVSISYQLNFSGNFRFRLSLFVFNKMISLCRSRMQHSVRVRKQLTPGTDICEITRREIRNATIFIWVVIVFILCQSVKVIPDLYEAFYCAHDEVRLFGKEL